MMRDILAQFTRREAHPAIQFIKYGIAGVIATATHNVIFFVLALWVFPGMDPSAWLDRFFMDLFRLDMPELSETTLQWHFRINNAIAFLIANVVAYLINFHWVFHPGRHRRHIEATLFLAVSTLSLLVGMQIGIWIMRWTQMGTVVSQIGNVTASVMINYVCRKYIVFKG